MLKKIKINEKRKTINYRWQMVFNYKPAQVNYNFFLFFWILYSDEIIIYTYTLYLQSWIKLSLILSWIHTMCIEIQDDKIFFFLWRIKKGEKKYLIIRNLETVVHRFVRLFIYLFIFLHHSNRSQINGVGKTGSWI